MSLTKSTKPILVYGKYTQREWDKLSYTEQVLIQHDYWLAQRLREWEAQAQLVRGIPGNQLQPYQA